MKSTRDPITLFSTFPPECFTIKDSKGHGRSARKTAAIIIDLFGHTPIRLEIACPINTGRPDRQDGDEVGLGNWCRELGEFFQLAVEEENGIGEFFSREAEGGAKEDLGRPAALLFHLFPTEILAQINLLTPLLD